jgi:hypothetical protein
MPKAPKTPEMRKAIKLHQQNIEKRGEVPKTLVRLSFPLHTSC